MCPNMTSWMDDWTNANMPERQRHVHFDDEPDEREHAERQRHVPTSSAEPSRTESDRHQKRKRDPDDNGINVRRKYDEEGYAELLLEDGLMMTRTTDTFDPQYIGHDEWTLQEPYVEPIQVFRFYTNQSSMQLEQEDSTRNWYRRR